MRANAFTAQILTLAETAGMSVSPIYQLAPRVERMYLNGSGWDGAFGIVEIGQASGRVLRGWIKYGNEGPKRHYRNATALRHALRALAA
jgi:hypothetical protein